MKVKEIWTDEDFGEMSWHDSQIHSISFPKSDLKLILDIDYLFKWELDEKMNLYDFWVSPCILTFSDVLFLKVALDFENIVGLDINHINRSNLRPYPNGELAKWDYVIATNMGRIVFESSGFLLEVKEQPIFSKNQVLPRL